MNPPHPSTQTVRNRPGSGRAKILFVAGGGLVILLLLLLLLPGSSCTENSGECTRVLFIGNSYTYVNDLPGTFTKLANAGGHKVRTGMLAQGGWTLADHLKDANTQQTLKSTRWDYVILQEQSEIPAFEQSRAASMYPAARQLVGQIRAAQAAPMFFETWAHSNGVPDAGIQDYGTMQSKIDAGYNQIAGELNVSVGPVGDAWRLALQQNPSLALWQADGSHPTEQGTYLAACVFYAAIFQQSPEGLSYLGGLPRETAHALQAAASPFVFKSQKK